MANLIEQLSTPQAWEQFLTYRLERGRFNWVEFDQADSYVEEERYLPFVKSLMEGKDLSTPQKKIINKLGTSRKRVVYSYGQDEMTVLKALSYLLYKYDSCFAPNCYAFRRGLKASDAVLQIHKALRGKRLWAYKVDIHNYFNSISVPIIIRQLSSFLSDDPTLFGFFERMLTNDKIIYQGKESNEPHGVMAGIPTAPFLADVYLNEMDHYFYERGILYARYSDDIIVFAEDSDTLEKHKKALLDFIRSYELEINEAKEHIYRPDEPYEFLGFKCDGDKIDISSGALTKMKGKIRRKTRALTRWRSRSGIPATAAIVRLINYFNRKFFNEESGDSLTWARWYFPIINCPDGLREIDHYLQQSIRALAAGRHTKSMYRVTYENMKESGYRSLVHEFYLFTSNRAQNFRNKEG